MIHMCIVYQQPSLRGGACRQPSLRENVLNILLCAFHICKYIHVQNSMAASPSSLPFVSRHGP